MKQITTQHHLDKKYVSPETSTLQTTVSWYFSNLYGVSEGPGTLPFYCDVDKVGDFAVAPEDLAAGEDAAVFRLLVTLSMYQALRDVVIMRHQRSLPKTATRTVADLISVNRSVTKHNCPTLLTIDGFEEGCNVFKYGRRVDCLRWPGANCHVKDATVVFNRMGDMGKLPTSAWLRHWKSGGVRKVIAEVCRREASPTRRASLLVEHFAQIHRVGRKIATLFVSLLSTEPLAPGLTPWFPDIDGNELVVVDTNVARAVDNLRPKGAAKTYQAREQWICEQAAKIDLRKYRSELPAYSPRLVQQALYAFCSKSNRLERGDRCADHETFCPDCAPALCPFSSTV